MKSSVIREMSLAEIREKIEVEKTMYLKIKMNHAVSSLDNPLKLKYARKTIARLSTELTNREKGSSLEQKVETLKTKTEALDIKEEIAENKKQENTDNNKSE
ncbi:MAG TPA: 50S ribosomal protein L29 [Flavobacteriales bacterium]|nr:50S ribosomal protein L29 [Flavobacteriales bacterium]